MKKAATETREDGSGGAPELVPVFVPGAELPLAAPQGGDALVLGPDLLADSLFGDVIDISELIPSLLPPAGMPAASAPQALLIGEAAGASSAFAHVDALLTVLYSDDDLGAGGAL